MRQESHGRFARLRASMVTQKWELSMLRNGALCPKPREKGEILSLAAKHLQFVSHFNDICWMINALPQVGSP